MRKWGIFGNYIVTGQKSVKLDSSSVNTTETENQPVENQANPTPEKKQSSVWVVFGTTFITIFLAEMGDKTQLSTLLMSAQSHEPWVVFLGSGIALITTSLLGVMIGGFLASKLSPKTVEKSAGIILLLISLMLVWEVIQG
ncbi:MAG: TMEM165/GDT1 family protein [Sphaerospermopsis sp. SIO1G1]|nr:TMEM165/GDT1 family protein [Sphaerospermopsis sp. SIO1G1]